MATQVFLLRDLATTHRGTNTAKLDTSASGWRPETTSTARGASTFNPTSSTVTGPTNGVEAGQATYGVPLEWITPPVDADVTIAGTITGNIWAAESNMSANVAVNFRVDKIAATDGTITQIVKSARTTEMAVTTRAVNNFTATPTSTVVNKGDRLRITLFGDDSAAATMASGFTFTLGYSGPTAAADGDTYISFTETFGFQTTDPTTTTVYLTNTASDVATADTDYEVWTARGDVAVTNLTNTVAGWTAPIQMTDAAGGTAMSWFTPQLEAFTLAGLVKCNVRSWETSSLGNVSFGVEIARTEDDGTGATIWGYANRDAATTSGGAGEGDTSETAYTVYVSGDDLAFTDGQRVRIRLFIDDCADIPMASGTTGRVRFDGPTGGGGGDTFLIFGQTLTEFTGGGDATASPGVIARSFTIPQVDHRASVSLVPTTIARSVVTPQAEGRAHVSVTPAATAATVAAPQASPSAAVSITPATVARSVSVPQVDQQASVSITPAVIATTVTIPQATPGIGASVTPDVIARTVTVPQADPQTAVSVTPAVIAATVTIPQVDVTTGGLAAVHAGTPPGNVNSNAVAAFTNGTFTFESGTLYVLFDLFTDAEATAEIPDSVVLSGATPPTVTRVTDATATWNTVATSLNRITTWWFIGDGVSRTITVTMPDAGTGNVMYVVAVTGANTSNPIVQGAGDEGDAGTSASTTLAAFADATNNGGLMFFCTEAGSAATAEGGWTPLGEVLLTNPNTRTKAAFRTGEDTSPSATFASSDWGIVALEIRVAGGGASVTPDTVIATVSVPQASPQTEVSLTPATLVGVASLAQATAQASSTATPDVIARSVVVPQASPQASVSITPAPVSASVSVPQASPQAAVSVTPATVATAVTIPQASPGVGTTVSPAVIARSFTVPQASPQAGASVSPAVIARTVSVPQASPQAGSSVTPAVVARSVTVPQATPQASSSVTPAAIARSVTVPQADVQASSSVTPATVAVVVSIPQTTVNAGGGATVTPDPISVVASIPQATAQASSSVTPAVISRAVTTPQASPSAGSSITPATVAGTVSVPQVTPQAGVSITPAVVSRSVSIPQATANTAGDAQVTPDTIARSVSIPQATPQASSSVTPAVISRSVSIGQASLQAGSSITPATIARAFAFGQASLQAGASVTPAVISRQVVIPQVTVQAAQTIAVGQATETDTAQTIAGTFAEQVNQALETDTAGDITPLRVRSIAQATETDLAQAVRPVRAKATVQATETDLAQAIAHSRAKAVAQALETDTATRIHTPTRIGQASETDVARPITATEAHAVAQATETDEAQPITALKTITIGQVEETDFAHPLGFRSFLAFALETDTARKIKALLGSGVSPGHPPHNQTPGQAPHNGVVVTGGNRARSRSAHNTAPVR